MSGSQSHQCECSDPGCPEHKGQSKCAFIGRTQTVYRIDMEDRTGTRMCSKCADDAYESGLFSDGPNFYSR
jgi:hypothetical protein